MEKLDDDTISNLLAVDWHLSDDELDFSDVEDFVEEKNDSEDEELEGVYMDIYNLPVESVIGNNVDDQIGGIFHFTNYSYKYYFIIIYLN